MSKGIRMINNVFEQQNPREVKSKDNIFGNFLVNQGLYDDIEITKENIFELADLIGGKVKLDVYCPKCGENRVFVGEAIQYYWYNDYEDAVEGRLLEDEIVSWQRINDMKNCKPHFSEKPEETWTWTNNFIGNETRLMVFRFTCSMDSSHHLDYVVLTTGNMMKKIGQFPSVADLSFPELKEYRKVMSKDDEKELKRAIGLYASGIGVGSFVYLRRIFERIIVVASQKAIETGKIEKEVFEKAHVDEKIKMLSDNLPKALVCNSAFYGIVSKGIHELSEEECLDYFPVMQSFILMILRQWEKIRKDEEDEKKLNASLNSIASKVK